MAITQIRSFRASKGTVDQTIKDALRAGTESAQSALGVEIQDNHCIQVTSEVDNIEGTALFSSLRESCGEATSSYDAELNTSSPGPDGPAAAPVMECAANYFPVSRITPEFQKKVEGEFLEFNRLCKTMARNDLGLAYGWCVNEQVHEDVEGGGTRPFLIMRGWQSMEDFENLTKQDKFREEAIPILLGWKAPFKMWHVQRRE